MNNYYVMYANPFDDSNHYSIKCCKRGCVYIKDIKKSNSSILVLTPIGKYKNLFPEKILDTNDINQGKYKAKLFDIPNEMFKAEGFRVFLDEQIEILRKVERNPSKYYMKYGNLMIIYKQYYGSGNYYIKYPQSKVFDRVEYNFILNYIYKSSWEYKEGFKLYKYPLLKRLFKIQNKFELRNPRREAEETC